MEIFWLILFIFFMVIRGGGKKQLPRKKALGRQPWDDIRQLQQLWFPEEKTGGMETGQPAGEAINAWEREGISAEWADLEFRPGSGAGAGAAEDFRTDDGKASRTGEQAGTDLSPSGPQKPVLSWDPDSLLQGIIMAEILQPPGGKCRTPYRYK